MIGSAIVCGICCFAAAKARRAKGLLTAFFAPLCVTVPALLYPLYRDSSESGDRSGIRMGRASPAHDRRHRRLLCDRQSPGSGKAQKIETPLLEDK